MVNENYYGAKDTWLTPLDYLPYIKRTKNILTLNIPKNTELDKTISFVCTDKNFCGNYVTYARSNGNEIKEYAVDIYDIDNTEEKFLYHYIFRGYNLTGEKGYSDVKDWNYDVWYEDATDATYQNISFYSSFGKNENIKLCIFVTAYSSFPTGGNSISVDIDTYNTEYKNNYPYVTNIYCRMYFLESDGKYRVAEVNDLRIGNGVLNFPTAKKNYYFSDIDYLDKILYNINYGNGAQLNDAYASLSIFLNSNHDAEGDDRLCTGVSGRRYIPCIGFFPQITEDIISTNKTFTEKGVKVYISDPQGIDTLCYRCIDLTDNYWIKNDFYEFCKKQTAYFGMFFVTSVNNINLSLVDTNTFLGIMDKNGITHGEYSSGYDNVKQFNFDIDLIDTEKKIPETEEKDSGDLTTNLNTYNLTSGQRYYAMVESNFNDVIKFINLGYRPTLEELSIDFKGKNPVDYIVNALIYPFDIPYSYELYNVTLGGINVLKSPYDENSEVVKAQYLTNSTQLFDFGTIAITPKYNDFRDYEPFTRCELQLPFCNTYVIDLKKFMGKNLTVKYSIDFPTGSCSAYIFLNDLVVDIVNGQIGYSIPLNGLAQGEYQNQIINSKFRLDQTLINTFSNFTNTATNIISGNVTGTINSIGNNLTDISRGEQITYNLKHTAPNISSISTASPLCSFSQDYRARLVFYRSKNPNFDKTIYGSTVGYACLKFGKLSSFSGFLVISNIKLDNINCTDTEKNMLKNLLTSGVYN